MWTDVVDLRDFYGESLGRLAARLLRRRIRELWPEAKGESLLGIGYATPYLRPFLEDAQRVLAVMPAGQGVLRWPADQPNVVALADEDQLPFPDLSMDRILLVHALEFSEQVRSMLREVWRVLSDRGRLLVVVPNRRGLWAQLERTPFGHGHPYTALQLSRLLRDNLFTPLRTATALHVPPIRSRMLLSVAGAWEQVGDRWLQTFAGVVLIEAAKEIYAANLARERRRKRRVYVPVPGGL
ncbi:MAG: class I SAM-dependent methyltransferase [Alphaproteobacteria bacterium]